jgi:predicted cupin superfamily sugar epimerase
MHSSEYWINKLSLKSHPEGGYYRETYRSTEKIQVCGLPLRFTSPRSFSTAIYFLLRSHDRSLFHRIKSDELWHFHCGGPLDIFVLKKNELCVLRLGSNPELGEALQVVVQANCWFGAKAVEPNTYSLASCTVAPGFDFHDFEIAERQKLLEEFPDHSQIIAELTK